MLTVGLGGCVARGAAPRALDDIARLERTQEPGGAGLLRHASDGDARVRARSLRALGRLSDPAVLSAILHGFDDRDSAVRTEAAYAVEMVGVAFEPLAEDRRASAQKAVLATLLPPATPERLERVALAFALGAVADADGARALRRLGEDADTLVAAAAARSLGNWHYRHPGAGADVGAPPLTLGEATILRRSRAYLAARMGSPAARVLAVAALGDVDADVRALGARALAAMQDPQHLRALARAAMQDSDWRVRVEAVRALAVAAANAAANAAAHATTASGADAGPAQASRPWGAAHLFVLSVVTAALWADQALYETPELAAPITELAADHGFAGTVPGDLPSSAMVLYAAFESKAPLPLLAEAARLVRPGLGAARESATGVHQRDLARLECLAAEALDRSAGSLDELNHCGGQVLREVERARMITRAIGRGGIRGAAVELAERATHADAGVRALAIEGLGGLGDRDASAEVRRSVLAALSDPDGPVVATAAEAAAKLGARAALPAIVAALSRFARPDDAEIAGALLEALGALHALDAVAAVTERLADPRPSVRAAARHTLGVLGVAGAPGATGAPDKTVTDLPPPIATPPPPPPGDAPSPTSSAAIPTRLHLHTDKGDVTITLATDAAPATARALAELARKGFYDGLDFHRVVPDFVVQGGDPRGDGWGGPGYTLHCEPSPLRFERGAVGMALAGKDTAGSQFFVTHSMQPHLDGRFTVVGRVTEGMDVVDRLLPGDRILKATAP